MREDVTHSLRAPIRRWTDDHEVFNFLQRLMRHKGGCLNCIGGQANKPWLTAQYCLARQGQQYHQSSPRPCHRVPFKFWWIEDNPIIKDFRFASSRYLRRLLPTSERALLEPGSYYGSPAAACLDASAWSRLRQPLRRL